MNVQGVEGVTDFMSHTGSQECERLDAFALDHFKGFLLLLSGVINDHRQAMGAFADQSSGIHAQETPHGIGDLQFMPCDR